MVPPAANAVVRLSAAAVVCAVLANFAAARQERAVRAERRSPVATASMSAFFLLLWALIHWHLGEVRPLPAAARAAGLALVAGGALVNLWGRLALARNWSNQVRIYADHALVRSGPFAFVRHPLYASLMAMGAGAALVYANPAVLLAVLVVFIPAMRWRAGLEERALAARFPDYARYQEATGMFLPRVRPRRQTCPSP